MSASERPQENGASQEAIRGWIEDGRRRLDTGDAAGGLELLGRAHRSDPADARAAAWYGLAVAACERRFDEAVELCRGALKQEFFNPELYLVMARVHLSFDFKPEAIRYLRRAQMIAPACPEVSGLLERLGQRQSQVIGFLPRGHRLNRLLGAIRTRLVRSAGREGREVAA